MASVASNMGCTHTRIHIHKHMHTHTHIHMHTNIHIHTHMYTHTHTHKHTHSITLTHNMWAMMWGTKRPTPGEVDCDCLFFLIFFLICLFLFLFIFLFILQHQVTSHVTRLRLSLQTVMMIYNWLAGVQFLEFMVFNVESKFLSLFVHGFKTAESRNNLIVANLALRKRPWVAIFCKTPPNPRDKEATREQEKEMMRVVECLQGVHGYKSQLDCQWALLAPAEVNGFVSGKIWAIARLGASSDVREVEKQRLNAVSLEEAQEYTEVAGELAADTLRVAHQNQNRGQGVTKAQYAEATMAFMEKENAFVKMYDKWLHEAANIHLEDRSKQVCRLKQTCTGSSREIETGK